MARQRLNIKEGSRGECMAEIYYWRDSKWMINVQYENRLPTVADVKRDYVKLPFKLNKTNERIFHHLNFEETNPLGSVDGQDWIRSVGLHHTSMSVGDVVKRGNSYYVVMKEGFKKIKEDCKHNYQFNDYCGAYVCTECGEHKGLARCFCGWNLKQGEVLEQWG